MFGKEVHGKYLDRLETADLSPYQDRPESNDDPQRYRDRTESAHYLTHVRGLKISKNTLQKMATVGGGPVYRRFGNRAVYTIDDLNAWADAKLSQPRVSTSEASAELNTPTPEKVG